MTRLICTVTLLLLFTLTFSSSSQAVEGVQCAMDVYQHDAGQDKDVLLFSDTAGFVKGLAATGFLVAFSVEIEFTAQDSAGCNFMVHTVTLDRPANNYSRKYRAEWGLPARMSEIAGKNGANYTLVLTPIEAVDIDTTFCGYSHRKSDDFRFDPSAYIDIHYVQNSFGDFYWNGVKGVLDERYRFFMALNKFNLPGKYQVYLAPCPIYSVIWDKRFGTMVDPTRNTSFAIFNRDINAADPFLIMHASVYNNYGYAPPFISEGYAGYLSLATYDMKKLVAAGKNVPLSELLDTYRYFNTDPHVADRTSATFAKYLINQYKIDKFRRVYREADDLNLKSVIESVYSKSIVELESEWLTYIDTLRIPRDLYRDYADVAEAMFDFGLMRQYVTELLPGAAIRADSLSLMSDLVRANFFHGDYYRATEVQKSLAGLDPDSPVNWMALGAYQMMNGLYDDASASLERALRADSADQMVHFNQAINAMGRGNVDEAKQILTGIVFNTEGGGPQAEARALLGNMLATVGGKENEDLATRYSMEAVNALAQQINSGAASSVPFLWTGIGYLGAGDTGSAEDFLQMALMLETRPFYKGMIYLWLGKVADVRGEHGVARDYYGFVLAGASADYHQKEARKYMDHPYRQ